MAHLFTLVVRGAAGIVGSQAVMNAAPDGYTLLSTNNGAMIVQAVKTGWIEGDGKYYPQPKVELRPRPKYDLSDRIYAVASSDDSLASAARLGCPWQWLPASHTRTLWR